MKKKKLKKKLHSLKERLQTNEYNEKILWEMLKKLIDKNGWSLVDLLPEDGLDGLENICRPMMYIRCTQQSKKIGPYKPYGAYKSIMGKSDNSGVAFSSCIDGEQKGIEEHIRKRHHMMEIEDATMVFLRSYDAAVGETGNPQIAGMAAAVVTSVFMDRQAQMIVNRNPLSVLMEAVADVKRKTEEKDAGNDEGGESDG